jgi:phage baseplate assembly protein W
MTDTRYAHLGTDLRVILGPAGFGAHDASSLDLRSVPRPSQRAVPSRRGLRPRPAAPGGDVGAPGEGGSAQGWLPEPPGAVELADLDRTTGRENLAQALTLRLLTPKGALAALGHAGYGSRLGELIGRNKTEALRGLCRAYILEAVREEPRVEDRPRAITFDPMREQPWDFVVEIVVQPVAGGDPVALGLEVGL